MVVPIPKVVYLLYHVGGGLLARALISPMGRYPCMKHHNEKGMMSLLYAIVTVVPRAIVGERTPIMAALISRALLSPSQR